MSYGTSYLGRLSSLGMCIADRTDNIRYHHLKWRHSATRFTTGFLSRGETQYPPNPGRKRITARATPFVAGWRVIPTQWTTKNHPTQELTSNQQPHHSSVHRTTLGIRSFRSHHRHQAQITHMKVSRHLPPQTPQMEALSMSRRFDSSRSELSTKRFVSPHCATQTKNNACTHSRQHVPLLWGVESQGPIMPHKRSKGKDRNSR